MVTLRFLTISSLVCLTWSTDARGQQLIRRNGLRADLVGCYTLYSGSARPVSSLYNASSAVRLDSLSVGKLRSDTTPGVLRVMVPLNASNEPVPPSRRRPAAPTWMADSLSDTVRLSFVDGFSGAVFVLAAPPGRPDTLMGRLFESWDFGPPFQTTHGPARAIRQPHC